jgi:hypothetical protein
LNVSTNVVWASSDRSPGHRVAELKRAFEMLIII